MKLKNVLLVVNDIEISKAFYQELFGLHIIADFGTNVILSEGLVLQELKGWQQVVKESVTFGGNNMELYFEEQDMIGFQKKIKNSNFNVEHVAEIEEEGNKVLRLYDPDKHIIEVKQKEGCLKQGSVEAVNQVLAIDIGGTSAKYAYVDVKNMGKMSYKEKFKTDKMKCIDDFLEPLKGIVKDAVEKGISKVGISSLGIFDDTGLCLGGVENLPFLKGVNLAQVIQSWYPQVDTYVINDGTAAALGEYWLGEGMDCDNYICMTLGTGIGGAIIIDGKPLKGSHFQSGEIGYSNYNSENDYMELKYSTKGILRQLAEKLEVTRVSGRSFTDTVRKGDPIYTEVFEHWMDELARMLANIVLVLDPEKIILGGGVSGEREWLCNALETKLNQHLPESFKEKVKVCVAKGGNDAGILGAAYATIGTTL